jgi:hypothetical protein
MGNWKSFAFEYFLLAEGLRYAFLKYLVLQLTHKEVTSSNLTY